MFYDEKEKHCRTKKEILDDNGNVRKGCKIVKKGEVYEKTLFAKKNPLFKQENFVDEVKHFYTNLINTLIEDDKEKLHVFDKNGLYLATKKIGKNNPKAELIQHDNEVRMKWNTEVDRAIVSEVPKSEIRQIKQEYITDKVKQSIADCGNFPDLFRFIVNTAISKLAMFISKTLEKAKELKRKLFEAEHKELFNAKPKVDTEQPIIKNVAKVAIDEPIVTEPIADESVIEEVIAAEIIEPEFMVEVKPQIPSKPEMPPEAVAYPKLKKIDAELKKQNSIIFEAEHERALLEIERDDLRGLARLT